MTTDRRRAHSEAKRAAAAGSARDARCACGSSAKHRGKTLCHACYERARRNGQLERRPARTDEERFFAKVEATDADGCWVWVGARYNGYGAFRVHRRTVRAHRWAWELFRGPIPSGLQLDHLCRNRACVNPDHLEPVTAQVNTSRGESPAATVRRTNVCRRGHVVDEYATWRNKRYCLRCKRERHAELAADPAWRAERAAYERDRRARVQGEHDDEEDR